MPRLTRAVPVPGALFAPLSEVGSVVTTDALLFLIVDVCRRPARAEREACPPGPDPASVPRDSRCRGAWSAAPTALSSYPSRPITPAVRGTPHKPLAGR
jgi:hypothetical protein